MEQKKDDERSIEEYFKTKISPIFEGVLKETSKNHMMVGDRGSKTIKFCYYEPHNCRLYFDFNKVTFKLPKNLKTMVLDHGFKLQNSTEQAFNFYYGFRIVVKKSKVEIIDKKFCKSVIKIPVSADAPEHFKRALEENETSCINILKRFISSFGGEVGRLV